MAARSAENEVFSIQSDPVFGPYGVRSVKSRMSIEITLFGETSLGRAVSEFLTIIFMKRNHQGKGNVILFPAPPSSEERARGTSTCRERLGGLLKCYSRAA
jgi:hypothetical protein